jgi:hypothetical protein
VRPWAADAQGAIMAKKRGPESDKQWVHLTDHGSHLFDQTNGMATSDFEASRIEATGMSDEERIVMAAAIMSIAAGSPS